MPERRVLIVCPTTRALVATGLSFTEEDFAQVSLTDGTVRCTACGQVHVWSKAEAFLDVGPYEPPAPSQRP